MALMCRLIAGSLLALSLQSVPAAAQYPNKPITVIVPFAAGDQAAHQRHGLPPSNQMPR